MRDQLLPLAVSEAEFDAWRAAPADARRTELPAPAFVELEGFGAATRPAAERAARAPRRRAARRRRGRAGHRRSRASIATRPYTGADAATPRAASACACAPRQALRAAVPDAGLNLENTTSSDFRITATARYLAFDVVGSGSELRIDGTIGSDPSLADRAVSPDWTAAVRRALCRRQRPTFNLIDDDAVIARYRQTEVARRARTSASTSARERLRVGAYVGHGRVDRSRGSRLPRVERRRRPARAPGVWIRRTARWCRAACWPRCGLAHSSTVPTSRRRRAVRLRNRADAAVGDPRTGSGASARAIRCSSTAAPARRSTDARCRPDQFALGLPFRLGAYAGRASAGPLLRPDRRLPAPGRPAAGLHGRPGVRRRLARERRCVRRTVERTLANRTAASAW